METVKSVVGLGKKENETDGQEPVSGEKGEGTATEAFDQGNQPEATQAAEAANTQGTKPEASAADTTTAHDSTKASDLTPAGEDKSDNKKSWFKNPFGKHKEGEEQHDTSKQASAGAEKPSNTAEEAAQEQKSLPPNHLGTHVPAGASTDLADPQAPEPISAQKTNDGTTNMSSSEQPTNPASDGVNQSVIAASADGVDNNDSTTSPSSSSKSPASKSKQDWQSPSGGPNVSALRGSRASIAAPSGQRAHNPHAENPNRIPIAGGVKAGSAQYERRKSRAIDPSQLPKVDQEGAPDPVTQTNTAANTVPQAAESTAGESKFDSLPQATENGSPSAAAGTAGTPGDATYASYSNEGTQATAGAESTDPTSTDQSAVDKAKEKVKENTPSKLTPGKDSSSPGGGMSKERRGSKFLDKIGFGKKAANPDSK